MNQRLHPLIDVKQLLQLKLQGQTHELTQYALTRSCLVNDQCNHFILLELLLREYRSERFVRVNISFLTELIDLE
jgi:hypothetical protein